MTEEAKLNIYQRMNAVMKDAEYIKKGKAGQGTGVLYDDVAAMLQPLFVKHGIAIEVKQTNLDHCFDVEGTKQKVFQGGYSVDFINIDNPAERSTSTAYAHGMDAGDKAPGKTQTYAVKTILTKVFLLETGINEESRAEIAAKKEVISTDQYQELYEYITETKDGKIVWNDVCRKLVKAYGIHKVEDLPAVKFDEALRRAKGAAS